MNTKAMKALILLAVGLVMGVIVLAAAGEAATILGLWLMEAALKVAIGSCVAVMMVPVVHRFESWWHRKVTIIDGEFSAA